MGYGLYVLSPVRLGLFVTVFTTRIAQCEKTPAARASGLHDFAVRARPAKALAGPRPYPASFVEDSFKRRSSARRIIAHGVQSTPRSLARPTLSRPSHPTARS